MEHTHDSGGTGEPVAKIILGAALLSTALTLAVIWFLAVQHPEVVRTFIGQHDTGAPVATIASETESPQTLPDTIERIVPAVVSIVVSADIPVIEQYYEEYNPFGDFFGRNFGFSIPRQRQIGTERQEIGGGTGFIVSHDGYIVTNRHVVDAEEASYSIVTNDGDTYDVEVVAKDPTLDIAVLKIISDSETTFPFLPFGDSSAVRLGTPVIAVGNALAEFPNSVSLGIISGLSRNIVATSGFEQSESLEGVIQTDAAINRGNSGGPLLTLDGRVVGVNVAVAGSGENIGFALPIQSVQSVYESVREHGEIVRPFIGVRYVEIDTEIARANNLSVDYGVLVIRGQNRTELAVIPGSPADKAGIEENDIILEINDERLDGTPSFAARIREFRVGDTLKLKVLHDGEEKEVEVVLEKMPAA